MTVSRVLTIVAALTLLFATAALAQGRGAAQRPGKVTTAQGPKQPGTEAPTPANRPADHPAATADRSGRSDKDVRRNDVGGRPEDAGEKGRGRDSMAERLSANPQQKARLEAILPSGMTLAQAADGFDNQGQFIAALEASKRENVSFSALKTEMLTHNLTLGQAIQKLKPGATR